VTLLTVRGAERLGALALSHRTCILEPPRRLPVDARTSFTVPLCRRCLFRPGFPGPGQGKPPKGMGGFAMWPGRE